MLTKKFTGQNFILFFGKCKFYEEIKRVRKITIILNHFPVNMVKKICGSKKGSDLEKE